MCGGKEDEDLGMEGLSGDVEDSPRCARPAKTLLFIINIIIWLGSCALLAFGIFALVDSPFTRDILDGRLLWMGSIVLIVVGSIGFIVSFIGCCGAVTSNKCLIMTYVVVLGILLALLLVGGILGFLFTNRLQTAAVDKMRRSLQKYDRQDEETRVYESWNTMQRSLKCCGVIRYKDWETYNSDFRGSQKIPESCCVINSDGKTTAGCTSATITSTFYSGDNDGCYEKVIMMIQEYTPIVAIVAAIVAFFMILGLTLGIIAFVRL